MSVIRRLFRKRGEHPPDIITSRLLTYRVANLQGQGSRQGQEDSFAFINAMDVTKIRQEGLLAAVADGMGGMKDGKLVSEAAVAEIAAGFSGWDRGGDIAAQLTECVLRTSELLYERFEGMGGTTAVICLFYQEMLYWASVGDSCIYLKRGKELYRLNQEQNRRTDLYLEAVRMGRLSSSEADADPDGHRLSQFLGKDELDKIDASRRPLELAAGDVLLLCSDGVGGVLSEDELSACLMETSPALACARMEEYIRAAGRRHQDNYTALVVMCGY